MIEFEVCPPSAGNMVCHLVMRGSRTVEELAGALRHQRAEARRTVKWLKAHNFIESSRLRHRKERRTTRPTDSVLHSCRVIEGLLV